MEYDSEEIYQKLSNYKIPLKTTSTTSLSSSSNDFNDGSIGDKRDGNNINSDDNLKNDIIDDELNQSLLSTKEDTFSSPLFVCEVRENDLSTSHIEYSREQNLCNDSSKTQDLFSRKRKYETLTEKPMFFGRDSSYPLELNNLIQPLYCSLCNAHLNSIKTARVHYESKSHDKKITNWLNEWSLKTGEPIPKIKRFVKDGPTGPDAFHCEACDLPLTSLQHASQHYNGKRHKMVMGRRADPSGSGFYNDEGKWVRQLTKPSKNCSQRFGIGDSFVKQTEVKESEISLPQEQDPSKYCSLCSISVTSIQQMEMHLNGTKHAKKLKLTGQYSVSLPPSPSVNPNETILASVTNPKQNDISIYRTPSGNYYCKICNVTLTDETLFQQHLGSKKHTKNLRSKSIEQKSNDHL